MKISHWILILVVVLLGWLAWTKLPGLRTSVSGAVDEYGGWTPEAREADPVGFISYAQEKLAQDIEAFKASRETLSAARDNASAQRDRSVSLLSAADDLAGQFRVAFQSGEQSGAWPATVGGASYTRDQLIEQVDSLLRERASYAKVADLYAEVMASAETQRKELRERIQTTEATLVELAARKELVRVGQQAARADELLTQIDALLSGNSAALASPDEPVRSVEELLSVSLEGGATADAGHTGALEFLEQE